MIENKNESRDDYRIPISGGNEIFIGIEEENEVFKEVIINGIKTRYLVSNLGRVYTKITTRVLVPSVDKAGYLEIALRIDKHPIWFRIHRLVIGCFYEGKPHTIETVNHKNGDKGDNRLENLEYCTCTENNQHFARELKCEQKQSGKAIVKKLQDEYNKINIAYSKQQKSNPRGKGDLSEDEYNEIVNLVESFYPNKLICLKYNIHVSIIKNIKRGSVKGRGRTKISDDELRDICKELQQDEYDIKEIAEKYNVRHSVIYSLLYKWQKTKYIWKDYFKE